MNQDDFDELVRSIREAGKLRRGELKPGRVTECRRERALLKALAKGEKEIQENAGFDFDAILNEADTILGNPES
jgi:hypothetical protein